MKNINIFKYALAPTCLLAIIGLTALLVSNNSHPTPTTADNNIPITRIQENPPFELDAKIVRIDAKIEDLANSLNSVLQKDKALELHNILESTGFYQNISLPSNLKYKSVSLVYTKNDKTGEYDIFHDYVITYADASSSEDPMKSTIAIAISKDYKPLEGHLHGSSPQVSPTNGIQLRSAAPETTDTYEMYAAEFSHKNLNFSIEANGVTENELKQLIKSITS